jgi:hypothetical protein
VKDAQALLHVAIMELTAAPLPGPPVRLPHGAVLLASRRVP